MRDAAVSEFEPLEREWRLFGRMLGLTIPRLVLGNLRALLRSNIIKIGFLTILILTFSVFLLDRIYLSISKNSSVGIEYFGHPNFWTYEPNSDFIFENEAGFSVHVSADSRGLRNEARVANDAQYDTIILGDSMIAAVNTSAEDNINGYLLQNGIRSYNAGMDGFGTLHSLNLISSFDDLHAEYFILVFYLGNDFRDNYWIRPLDYQLDTNQKFINRILDFCSFLNICRDIKATHFVPQAHDPMGSYATSEILMVSDNNHWQMRAVEVTRATLSDLQSVIADRGGELIVVGVPSKAQTLRSLREISTFDRHDDARDFAETRLGSVDWDKPSDLLGSICGEIGIEYMPLVHEFRTESQYRSLFYDFDAHWNEAGQAVAAEAILARLRVDLP